MSSVIPALQPFLLLLESGLLIGGGVIGQELFLKSFECIIEYRGPYLLHQVTDETEVVERRQPET